MSLLETDHKGNYWLHLVHEFAYDDLENKIESHKLACEYYLRLSLPENVQKEDVTLIEAHYHACVTKSGTRQRALSSTINFTKNFINGGTTEQLLIFTLVCYRKIISKINPC